MKVMDVGRVCYKTKGRTTADRVVVAGEGEKNNVIIKEGKGFSECNIRHLFPTREVEKVEEVKLGDLKKTKEEKKEKQKEKPVKSRGKDKAEKGKKEEKKSGKKKRKE